MSSMFFEEVVAFQACDVRIRYFYDPHMGTPWEECDGHGVVRSAHAPWSLRPGERLLKGYSHDRHAYLYHWDKSLEIAKRDGWDAEPYGAPDKAERAVQADFDFLRAWLNDEWHYVFVEVQALHKDGREAEGFTDTLGGLESYKDYHLTGARELADDLAARYDYELASKEEGTWA